MRVLSAEFRAAATHAGAIPAARHVEIAVAGRSNVGKSSLLNRLTARKRLARTSKTPGCTRGLVFFDVHLSGAPDVTLVDLPGYGYASRSKSERAAWRRLVEGYLVDRDALAGVLLLVDVRRGAGEAEIEMADYLVEQSLSHAWVLTKADKLKRSGQAAAVRALAAERAPADIVLTSSTTGAGVADVWSWIRETAEAS